MSDETDKKVFDYIPKEEHVPWGSPKHIETLPSPPLPRRKLGEISKLKGNSYEPAPKDGYPYGLTQAKEPTSIANLIKQTIWDIFMQPEKHHVSASYEDHPVDRITPATGVRGGYNPARFRKNWDWRKQEHLRKQQEGQKFRLTTPDSTNY